jgi:CheY-like chemotaxis protein
MTQPLAIVFYEKLLPGTQLVNRLQDLNYRVRAITDVKTLAAAVRQEKPMLVLADLSSSRDDVCAAIRQLKQSPDTQHIPVVGFAPDSELKAGHSTPQATLVVSETAIVNHLPQFLEQALRVE